MNKVVDFYNANLSFKDFRTMKLRPNTDWNYSYYPVIFKDETMLLKVQQLLNEIDVFPRRYFYPSLNKLEYLDVVAMPVSEKIAKSIICLPLYVGLDESDLDKICKILNSVSC